MHPPWRRECAVQQERSDDGYGADDEDQEGGGSVTDIEARKIESACTAAIGKADPALKERMRSALRTISGERRLKR